MPQNEDIFARALTEYSDWSKPQSQGDDDGEVDLIELGLDPLLPDLVQNTASVVVAGFPVIALWLGTKKPLHPAGSELPNHAEFWLRSVAEVEAAYLAEPWGCQFAVMTGVPNTRGDCLVVLDNDEGDLDALLEQAGEEAQSWAEQTLKVQRIPERSHLYGLVAVDDCPPSMTLDKGLEWRGTGGYVLLPGAQHPDGQWYQFTRVEPPLRVPRGLIALVRAKAEAKAQPKPASTTGEGTSPQPGEISYEDLDGPAKARIDAYLEAALDGITATLVASKTWPEGRRDDRGRGWEKLQADAAHRLARLVLAAWNPLDQDEAYDLFIAHAPIGAGWTAAKREAKWRSQWVLAARKGPAPYPDDDMEPIEGFEFEFEEDDRDHDRGRSDESGGESEQPGEPGESGEPGDSGDSGEPGESLGVDLPGLLDVDGKPLRVKITVADIITQVKRDTLSDISKEMRARSAELRFVDLWAGQTGAEFDPDKPEPKPSVLRYSTFPERFMLTPGFHILFGPKSVMKTWISAMTILQEVREGRLGLFFDYEDTYDDFFRKLHFLGATAEERARVTYLRPPGLMSDIGRARLVQEFAERGQDPKVIVIDSLGQGVAAYGLDDNASGGNGVGRFIENMVMPLKNQWQSTTLIGIDHLPKGVNPEIATDPLGSGRKGYAADGLWSIAALGAKPTRDRSGTLRSTCRKDRRGWYAENEPVFDVTFGGGKPMVMAPADPSIMGLDFSMAGSDDDFTADELPSVVRIARYVVEHPASSVEKSRNALGFNSKAFTDLAAKMVTNEVLVHPPRKGLSPGTGLRTFLNFVRMFGFDPDDSGDAD